TAPRRSATSRRATRRARSTSARATAGTRTASWRPCPRSTRCSSSRARTPMTRIVGEAALAKFRRTVLTGAYGLDLLRRHGGRVLAQLPVGVGKSRWMDSITLEALQSGAYDLAVVLAPTRQLIAERGPLRDGSHGLKVVTLRRRPAEHCGPERDAA